MSKLIKQSLMIADWYPKSSTLCGVALALCLTTIAMSTVANDLFTLSGTVADGGQQQNRSYSANTYEGILDILRNELDNKVGIVFSLYNDNALQGINVTLGIRGIEATASFAEGGTQLVFDIPSLGIHKVFSGATRDESFSLLAAFWESEDILSMMLQKQIQVSPVDPVAGNPNSLQGLMSAGTFSVGTGFGSIGEPMGKSNTGVWSIPNLASAGGDIGVVDAGGFQSFVFTLPLRYSLYLDNPSYALTIDAPLTYIDTEGAKIGTGSVGLSFRMPVLKNWYLTPSVRIGATASEDFGTAAIMYSGDITSLYNIYAGDFKISIGNGLGYYKTYSDLSIGDISIDYDFTNTALKNGVSVEAPLRFTMFGRPTSWQAYVIDTQMFGEKLYLEHYDEIGFLLGTRQSADSQSWDSLRLGLSFTFGDDYKALKANFNYRF